MSSGAHLTVIPGAGPVVLLAPHGGRRNVARHPWTSGRLRVNDLHTASLTAELAHRLDAPALINADHDRNEVDLNRVSEAHERAPWFLEALAHVLDTTLARHRRATVLVVHGWNVIEPVADLGLGCLPGPRPFAVDGQAAVSSAFAASAVRTLVGACAARGIAATLGVRYPARHRENLLQLFTARYREDPRSPVRAVAALAPRVDAVQLELGIPLRWPGAWRARFLDACHAALPALAGVPAPGAAFPAELPGAPEEGAAARLEFTSPALCGLVAVDRGGGRLLLFPPGGGLVLFTGDRIAARGPNRLCIAPTAGGGLAVRLRGPLLRFPDTTPFLDLEPGLVTARLVEADVVLDFGPDAPGRDEAGGGSFGRIAGCVNLAGTAHTVAGDAFAAGALPEVWPRFRAAFRVHDRAGLALTLGPGGEPAHGFLQCGDREDAVVRAGLVLGPPDAPLERVALAVELASGERLDLTAHALHRLPVIRGRPASPVRLEFAACRLEGGGPGAAGWCELGGL